MQPVQIAEEEPKMQENENSGGQANPDQVKNEVSPGVIQVADTGIRREKNIDPSGQTTQVTGSQAKDPVKSEEKKDKKNATPTVQKPSANRNNSESTSPKKQPNNIGLYKTLTTGCALLAVGCLVAAAIKIRNIVCHRSSICYSGNNYMVFNPFK